MRFDSIKRTFVIDRFWRKADLDYVEVEQLSPRQTRLTIWWEGWVRISPGAPNLDLPRRTVHFSWNQDVPESRTTPGSGMRAIVPPIYARRQIAPTNPQSWALKRPCSALAIRRANST